MAVSTIDPNGLNIGQIGGTRNRIINGGMVIDQRNAGAAVTPSGGSTYSVDRWQGQATIDTSKFSIQQSTIVPGGFINSVKITSLTAYSSPTTDSIQSFKQMIELGNIADNGWGTSSAKPMTLSFWIRSSVTGTFSGAVTKYSNGTVERTFVFTYTISSADTWEYKNIIISADTNSSYVYPSTLNGEGVQVRFDLGGSATRKSSTVGEWVTGNYFGATTASNFLATNGATMYITGVQLEAGDTATPFEHRSYGQELALCQRYYEKSYQQSVAPGASGQGNTGVVLYIGTGNSVSNGDKLPMVTFMVVKRTAPTILIWSPAGTSNRLANMAGSDLAAGSATPNVSSDKNFFAYQNSGGSVSGTSGCVEFHYTASAEL